MEEKLAQRSATCLRFVIFGPESTGKTTLSEDLSKHFKEPLVPEYMRTYLQQKWDEEKKVCEPEDLIPIAEGQMRLENEKISEAKNLIICDTNLLELKVYAEAYYDDWCPEAILKHALNNQYDCYFLTYIDVPWVSDDLRDKPHDREGMFKRFKEELIKHDLPYQTIKGNRQDRLNQAIEKINQLLKSKP